MQCGNNCISEIEQPLLKKILSLVVPAFYLKDYATEVHKIYHALWGILFDFCHSADG